MTSRTEPGAALPEQEKHLRVVYEGLRAAGRLALGLGVPVRELPRWLQLGIFHELRSRGRRQREIADDLGFSMRKVALLARALKDNFMDAHPVHTLPRRIEYMLWAEPMSEARIGRALPEETPAAIRVALARLVQEGRVREEPGRIVQYAASRPQSRMVRDEWLARVDGLTHLLDTVVDAIYGRFFEPDPGFSFVRTVSLRVRRDDLAELNRLYETRIWPALCALDEAAGSDPDAVEVNAAWVVAPRDLLRRRGSAGKKGEEES